MKDVIAYSLWGDKPMYWKGALRNIEQAAKYFPGWICRFYIDRESDPALIDSIKGENVEVVLVDSAECNGMFWRFWASADDDTDTFLSRDCDSRLTAREVKAINEWLASDKDFHIMRDHPYHTTQILGGMWGSRNGYMAKIGLREMIKEWSSIRNGYQGAFGIDQDFLAAKIYPIVAKDAMEHSEFGISFGNEVRKFPSTRIDYEFIGDTFDENDERHPEYWKIVKRSMGN